MAEQLVEYTGAVHIHTRYSDGSGDLRHIVEAAREAELDFVIITDHDTVRAKRQGWEGWREGVLVLVGVEVSPSGADHCLAFGVRHCAGLAGMPKQRYLASIADAGGDAYLAHPLRKDFSLFPQNTRPPRDWRLDGYVGLEAWSYMHDWIDGLSLRSLWRALRRPEERIRGPLPEVLRQWDFEGCRRRVVAIAGLDAHAQRFPLTWFRVFSYRHLFRSLRTHVIAPPFAGNLEKDQDSLRKSIREGRCFMANDALADSRGFRLYARKATGDCVHMGAEIAFQAGLRLEIVAPQTAQLGLVRDGSQFVESRGIRLAAPAPGPGVYRAEVLLHGKPWIFSNPLYLR